MFNEPIIYLNSEKFNHVENLLSLIQILSNSVSLQISNNYEGEKQKILLVQNESSWFDVKYY